MVYGATGRKAIDVDSALAVAGDGLARFQRSHLGHNNHTGDVGARTDVQL
jgi:hypothetical protein